MRERTADHCGRTEGGATTAASSTGQNAGPLHHRVSWLRKEISTADTLEPCSSHICLRTAFNCYSTEGFVNCSIRSLSDLSILRQIPFRRRLPALTPRKDCPSGAAYFESAARVRSGRSCQFIL